MSPQTGSKASKVNVSGTCHRCKAVLDQAVNRPRSGYVFCPNCGLPKKMIVQAISNCEECPRSYRTFIPSEGRARIYCSKLGREVQYIGIPEDCTLEDFHE